MVVVGRNIPVTLIDMDKVGHKKLCLVSNVDLKSKWGAPAVVQWAQQCP